MKINLDQTLHNFQREEEEGNTQVLAKKYGMNYVNLIGYPVLFDILKIIPQEFAIKYQVIAYIKIFKTVRLAINREPDQETVNALEQLKTEKKYDLEFEFSLCSNASIDYGITLYKTLAEKTEKNVKTELKSKDNEGVKAEITDLVDFKNKITKVSTTNLLEVLFDGAMIAEASDIHLEPEENQLRLRYRIDGVLQDITMLPLNYYYALRSRIKYMSKMKLDVMEQAQDGRFEIKTLDKLVDVRVATLPTAFGEEIVMRILPKDKRFLSLEQLGFSEDHLKIIREAIKKPNGIIFNTGPTGSGKTTTLYAILSELNKSQVKIITLEDPIEYRIEGLDQSQVEPDQGYTFATGLRAILRHDPDIIMVGEIRDKETAEIAMHSALTGHLVLTTLHTNNAPSALPRLLDMGVPEFLLGGTINLIIAQRLVRKTCITCKGKGCKVCNLTGYKGRVVICELLVPNKEIEDLVRSHGTISDFSAAAKKAGMISMSEDGAKKVVAGITTQEEIDRVIQD